MMMMLTDLEYEVIEMLREWAADPQEFRLLVSFENGAWECVLTERPHPHGLTIPADSVLMLRGVGTSFFEAFARLDGNDDEAIDDDAA
jgi:hypothetical protein